MHLAAAVLIGGALLYWWHSGDTHWALVAFFGFLYIGIGAGTRRSSLGRARRPRVPRRRGALRVVLDEGRACSSGPRCRRTTGCPRSCSPRSASSSSPSGSQPPAALPPNSRLYNQRRGETASYRRPRPPGQLPRARAAAARAGRGGGRGAQARAARRARRARDPGRRVDHDHAADAALRDRRGSAALRAPDLRHLRGDDRARPGAPRPAGRRRAPERLRPPGRELRDRSGARGRSASRCAASSSARPGSRRPATTSRCSPSTTAAPSWRARAGSSSPRSTRS